MSKKLIALALIAAASYYTGQPAYAVGDKFEAPDDIAGEMVADQVAKLDESADDAKPAVKGAKLTKVRLLVDSALGNANDVVELDAGDLKQAVAANIADADKGAVAYALGLPQNKPPA